MRFITACLIFLSGTTAAWGAEYPLRIAHFQADVTPPLGAPLCYGVVKPAQEIVGKLSARGIVLLTADKPIVLCAVDWLATSNGGYDEFRQRLATAAGTTADRVALHCLHQHDAPGVDFSLEEILAEAGLSGQSCDVVASRAALTRTAEALQASLPQARTVTHLGHGRGKVVQVASNRRILGPDGKVKMTRWSAMEDPEVRAQPEGTIDPYVQLLCFWEGDRPLASLTYYATHPQSYYNTGGVNPDFPGAARALREAALPHVAHIHFDGAGGNITAGKYNDGNPENRPILARRLATGMQAAWDSQVKTPLSGNMVQWRVKAVALPPAPLLNEQKLLTILRTPQPAEKEKARVSAAMQLVWLRRCLRGEKVDISCLHVGPAAILHLPGELFVEYQLAAQKLRPGKPVCLAAYGDDGTGYIGTQASYAEGGYETGPASRVAPQVESVLMGAMRELLK